MLLRFASLIALYALCAAHAFPQNSCATQNVPNKPSAMLTCSNAAPICITGADGTHGHWAWMCPGTSNTNSPGPKFLDPSVITNSVPPPSPGDSLLDTVQRLYQLKQLQLQNQQIQEQNRALEAERERAEQQRATSQPAPEVAPERTPASLSFKKVLSGNFFESCGLSKLSPEELARLDSWLTIYTTSVIEVTKADDRREAALK